MSSAPKEPGLKLYPVESSYLDRVGYDLPASSLHVIFKDQTHYAYAKVGHDTFLKLLDAPSKGTFFSTQIKGKYRAINLTPPKQTPKR